MKLVFVILLFACQSGSLLGQSSPLRTVYLDERLIFLATDENSDQIDLVVLRTRAGTAGTFGNLANCVGQTLMCSVPTLTPVPATLSLADVFVHPACTVPCYQGIIPRVTTAAGLETILSSNGVSYTTAPLGREQRLIIYTFTAFPQSPFILNEQDSISVDVTGGLVDAIYIRLNDVTANTVLETFGAPTAITTGSEVSSYIIYVQHGLVFPVLHDTHSVEFVFVHEPGVNSLRTQYFLERGTCDETSGLCAIATATPVP